MLTELYYDIPSKSVNITINHKYKLQTIGIPTDIINQEQGWYKFHDLIAKSLTENGVSDLQDVQEIKYAIDDNNELIYRYSSNSNSSKNNSNENEKSKREFVTYKYSKMGKGQLHEAVIVNGLPFFVKYNHESNDI